MKWFHRHRWKTVARWDVKKWEPGVDESSGHPWSIIYMTRQACKVCGKETIVRTSVQ